MREFGVWVAAWVTALIQGFMATAMLTCVGAATVIAWQAAYKAIGICAFPVFATFFAVVAGLTVWIKRASA